MEMVKSCLKVSEYGGKSEMVRSKMDQSVNQIVKDIIPSWCTREL